MLDYALAQTLAKLCAKFEVMPAFSYYKEPAVDDFNALATQELLLGRADGTVLYGLNMLAKQLGSAYGDAAVVAVAAHEFGHIVAMKRGLNGQLAPDLLQPFRAEQFADFMAGVYAGFRKLEGADIIPAKFAMAVRSLAGDTRETHGTTEERGLAVAKGYEAAYTNRLNLDNSVNYGFNFAMSRT